MIDVTQELICAYCGREGAYPMLGECPECYTEVCYLCMVEHAAIHFLMIPHADRDYDELLYDMDIVPLGVRMLYDVANCQGGCGQSVIVNILRTIFEIDPDLTRFVCWHCEGHREPQWRLVHE